MTVQLACITDERLVAEISAQGVNLQPTRTRSTPFGPPDSILTSDGDPPFHLICPQCEEGQSPTLHEVNSRANLYALKDLGVRSVLAVGPAQAIKHDIAVGEPVIAADLLDMTYRRTKTFFADRAIEYLRQFPVFCPALRKVVGERLSDSGVNYHAQATAAVCDDPRLRTPAEVRMLSNNGADVITHHFVPEVFLAKELQLCYAAVGYIYSYAETGSPHRPLTGRPLFAGVSQPSDSDRLTAGLRALAEMLIDLPRRIQDEPGGCECDQTMAQNIRRYELPQDWREWFPAGP